MSLEGNKNEGDRALWRPDLRKEVRPYGGPASARKPGLPVLNFVHRPFFFLFLILLVSAALHLVRIGTPDRPVFDEAYFATYATNDALQMPYFDIHPPFGRFLYSIPLFFYNKGDLAGATYVVNEKTPDGKSFTTTGVDKPYENFPYMTERVVSALFGLLLIVSVFLFVRELAGERAALLTAFFIALENALLLDTRLILMDGMYLSFGFLALYFFFRKAKPQQEGIDTEEKAGKTGLAPLERALFPLYQSRNPILSGIFLGLALSVKLTAIVFAGPVIVAAILKSVFTKERARHWDVLWFLGVAALVFLILLIGVTNALFTPEEQLSAMGWLFNIPDLAINPSIAKATLYQLLIGGAGYTVGGGNLMMSPWYLWPFMIEPMRFTDAGNIMLLGNPFVWILSTLAVLGTLLRYVRQLIRRASYSEGDNSILILLFGYIFALLPFFTFINRATFLYHYFPALLLAIALLATLVTRALAEETKHAKMLAYGAIGILTVWGFILVAPYTYGL